MDKASVIMVNLNKTWSKVLAQGYESS